MLQEPSLNVVCDQPVRTSQKVEKPFRRGPLVAYSRGDEGKLAGRGREFGVRLVDQMSQPNPSFRRNSYLHEQLERASALTPARRAFEAGTRRPSRALDQCGLARTGAREPCRDRHPHIIVDCLGDPTSCEVCRRISEALFDFLKHYQHDLCVSHDVQQGLPEKNGLCGFHTRQLEAVSSQQGLCEGYPPLLERWSLALREAARGMDAGRLDLTRSGCSHISYAKHTVIVVVIDRVSLALGPFHPAERRPACVDLLLSRRFR